jgi:hypothetical protein
VKQEKKFTVGDLVFLDFSNIVGIIININIFDDDIVDVEVQWSDGERCWCLAEGLVIVSKINKN